MDAHARLRAWFESSGLTQAQAADLLDCHTSFVQQLLSDPRPSAPGQTRLPKLPGRLVAHAIERATASWVGGQILAEEWDALERERDADRAARSA